MTKNRRKKRSPAFWIVLAAVAVLVIVFVQLVIVQLKKSLTRYEAAQPDGLAETIFDTYYRDGVKFEALLEKTGYSLAPGETGAQLAAYLRTLCTQDVTYSQVYAADSDHQRYVVMSGDTKISAFTLRRGEKVTFRLFGHDFQKLLWMFDAYQWEVDSFELFWEAGNSVTVSAPEGARVLANGVWLEEQYFTGELTETDSCAHMPQGVTGLRYKTYKADGFLEMPAVQVFSADGQLLPLTEISVGVYRAEVISDSALESRLSAYVLEAVQAYACFMQEDKNFNQIKKYFDSATALYENIRTTQRFVWEHDSYEFIGSSAGKFYAYDENTVSCSVTFTQVLHKGSQTWSDTPLKLTVYLRQVDGAYLIYDMVNE